MSVSPALTQMAARLGGDLDDALDQLRIPAHLVDRGGLVRWQNERSIDLLGDLRGRLFTEMFAPEALPAARVQFAKKILGTARATDFETVLRRPSGERVPVEIHSVAIEGGDGAVAVLGVVDVDVDRPVQAASLNGLTPRQLDVLRALARGCSTAQIAADGNVSRETVRNHVRGLFRALRVHSRVAAVAEARRRGIVD
jgi:DNA-binding CsgD family transcriptional regulator